jgi:hypothetical protein
MLGSSGTRMVDYTIREWTDNTRTTPKNFEKGIGSLNLTTMVLTRSIVERTYDGTTYKPNAAGATPAALSFGTTPANIIVMCAPSVESFLDTVPFLQQSGSNPLYLHNTAANFVAGDGGGTGIAIWFPVRFHTRLSRVSSASLSLKTAISLSTVSALFFGLYECPGAGGGGNNIGNLIADFGNGSAISTLAATGTKTGTLTTPIANPGWCWGCLLMTFNNAGDAPAVAGFETIDGWFATGAGGIYASKTSQSGLSALPSTGGSAGGTTAGNVPGVVFA